MADAPAGRQCALGRGVHRAVLARRLGPIVVASDGVVHCPTAFSTCASNRLLEVVAAHDEVHDNLLIGDELLCLELLLLGMELRDLRDALTSTTQGCRVAAAMLTELPSYRPWSTPCAIRELRSAQPACSPASRSAYVARGPRPTHENHDRRPRRAA